MTTESFSHRAEIDSELDSGEGAIALRRTPLHYSLARQNAVFGDSVGWAQPLWFGTPENPDEAVKNEHLAARAGVVVLDSSRLTKFVVEGPDALALLDWLSTNNCDCEVGKIVYTTWCDDQGTVVADITVTRLGLDRFLVLGTDTVHDYIVFAFKVAMQSQHLTNLTLTETTLSTATISVQGPSSRELLGRMCDADLSDEAFPYMTAQAMKLTGIDVMALRITFSGELGWEIHLPAEVAARTYDMLFEIGKDLGIKPCGFEALASLGAEQGYLDFDLALKTVMTPLEANLGFTISYEKPNRFRGQAALESQLAGWPPPMRLAMIRLSDPLRTLKVGDGVYRFGLNVGQVVMGAYGHSVGAAVGYVELTNSDGISDDWIASGDWSVGKGALSTPAVVSTRPWFDPHRVPAQDVANNLVAAARLS